MHKYLIYGHIQNKGDSAHSNTEKQIKKARKSGAIYVPDQYVSLIRLTKNWQVIYDILALLWRFSWFLKSGY